MEGAATSKGEKESMSRVLPFRRPTLDHELWEQVQNERVAMTKEIAEYLALRDIGNSNESDYWTKDGRLYPENDNTVVYDFIALSYRFDDWFEKRRKDPDGLLEEIKEYIMGIDGAQSYFEGCEREWLELDFGVLGRAIGAAVANIGFSEGWWRFPGNDARLALRFWGELGRENPKMSRGEGIPASEWDSLSRGFRERNFDPNSEILRAFTHRPSSPFWQQSGHDGVVYFPNPIVIEHRKNLRNVYQASGPLVDEIAKYHGRLTMKLIQKAIVQLTRGNYAAFAVGINAVCAHHVMRTSVIQQKIGLHLICNLAVRKMTRSVGAQNVPDIAEMGTGFNFGKVLNILFNSKLIDWYTIEKSKVDEVLLKIS